jgi:hypothetical protein
MHICLLPKRDWQHTQSRSTGLMQRSSAGSAHLDNSSADTIAVLTDPELVRLNGRRLGQRHCKCHRLGGVAAA